MLNKMPGDEWQRFANLRLLYTYMFTHPGKKLLFMGTEFGQGTEWDSTRVLDWYVLDYDLHRGLQTLVRDLNRLYHDSPALYTYEFEWQGFDWIDCHDADNSVLSYLRKKDDDEFLVMAVNFTPVPRQNYRIGVPKAGAYQEILNSDAHHYGGSGISNMNPLVADEQSWMNRPYSLAVTLPPLGGIVLKPAQES
jgi:1,4-alpha-glucan branching enzyme